MMFKEHYHFFAPDDEQSHITFHQHLLIVYTSLF